MSRKYLWFLPALIGGIIARFWLIHAYTFLVPDSDQWTVDVQNMFLPLKLGTFHLSNLFIPFYEHRLAWQRLYDLAFYKLNGDHINNVLQCRITAVIFCVVVCGVGIMLARKVGRVIPIAIGCATITMVPFGWESTVGAFQTQTYFYEAAVFGGCYAFACEKRILGCVIALAGIFTTATGFISVVAYGIYLLMYFLLRANRTRENLLSLAMRESFYIAIAIVGVSCIAFSPYDKNLAATSVSQFLEFFCRYLAWPCYLSPSMVWFNLLPVGMVIFLWAQSRITSKMVDFIIIAFIAIVLQSAILAHGRANSHSILISRYQDQVAPLLILNILSLCVLYDYIKENRLMLNFITGAFSLSAAFGFAAIITFCQRDSLYWAGLNKQYTEAATLVAYQVKDPQFFYQNVKDTRIWPGRDERHNPEVEHFCAMMKDTNITSMVPYLSDGNITFRIASKPP